VRFISAEPLIGALGNVGLSSIHRARQIRDPCASQDMAFFFKQWLCLVVEAARGEETVRDCLR
jgi:protein gp37